LNFNVGNNKDFELPKFAELLDPLVVNAWLGAMGGAAPLPAGAPKVTALCPTALYRLSSGSLATSGEYALRKTAL
jgi:hypothetical protein